MPETLPEHWKNDAVVGYFNRHVVPIYLDFRNDRDERKEWILTAFPFSVRGRWLLVTAGHCITDVRDLRATGFKLIDASLLDNIGSQANYKGPVPFRYDDSYPTKPGKDKNCDYGVLFPSTNECQLLAANGVRAFTEASWDQDLDGIAFYKLLGIPSERVVTAGERSKTVTTLFATVERLPERPPDEGFVETDAPMFYGRLKEHPRTNLRGMSGSPILAFDGKGRYWLAAMQVSAVRNRLISGMLMRPLGNLIQDIADEHDRVIGSQQLRS